LIAQIKRFVDHEYSAVRQSARSLRRRWQRSPNPLPFSLSLSLFTP
jgi:hypothetical protein